MIVKSEKLKEFLLPCEENNYRPSILSGRFLSYLAFSFVILKFISLFYYAIVSNVPAFADITTGALVKMANAEREASGLRPLTFNYQLAEAARLKATDMIENDYFSHWSPDGKSPWHWIKLAGYDYYYAGENLAAGFFDAKEVHRAWINSASHKENIVNPYYQEVGIAVVKGDFMGHDTFLVVQMFGSLRDEKISMPAETEPQKEVPEDPREESPIAEEFPEEETAEDLPGENTFVLGEYDTGRYIYPSGGLNEIKFGFLEFLMLKYDDLIQKALMISLLFMGFVLVVNVFVRFDVQHPDIILKGVLFLGLLILFDHLDQSRILELFDIGPIIG